MIKAAHWVALQGWVNLVDQMTAARAAHGGIPPTEEYEAMYRRFSELQIRCTNELTDGIYMLQDRGIVIKGSTMDLLDVHARK